MQIDRSIGPVWEANHVWLIFVLVVLWTAFSTAFSAIMSTLYIPLALAALGIVLRGSSFAFRHALPGPVQRPATRMFGVASVLTPFFMGTVVGAIASGEVPAGGDGDPTAQLDRLPAAVTGASSSCCSPPTRPQSSWCATPVRPATASCGLLRAPRSGCGVVAGAAAVVGVIALHADARYVYDGLTSWPGIALVILSGICGLVALGLLVTGRSDGLRVAGSRRGTAVDLGLLRGGLPVHPADLADDLGRGGCLDHAHRGDRGLRGGRRHGRPVPDPALHALPAQRAGIASRP